MPLGVCKKGKKPYKYTSQWEKILPDSCKQVISQTRGIRSGTVPNLSIKSGENGAASQRVTFF